MIFLNVRGVSVVRSGGDISGRSLQAPFYRADGKLITRAQIDGANRVLLDGKVLNPDVPAHNLTVSASGRVASRVADGLWLDGAPIDLGGLAAAPWFDGPFGQSSPTFAQFSPDGRRISVVGHDKPNKQYAIFVDGKKIATLDSTVRRMPMFTPDGRGGEFIVACAGQPNSRRKFCSTCAASSSRETLRKAASAAYVAARLAG